MELPTVRGVRESVAFTVGSALRTFVLGIGPPGSRYCKYEVGRITVHVLFGDAIESYTAWVPTALLEEGHYVTRGATVEVRLVGLRILDPEPVRLRPRPRAPRVIALGRKSSRTRSSRRLLTGSGSVFRHLSARRR